MGRELAWVCGLVPEDVSTGIVRISKEANRDIGLPETVFRFPLHISMKKSFSTDDFAGVKAAVVPFIEERGSVECRTGAVARHKGMLWLPVEAKGAIAPWHEALDGLLEREFSIPISGFDRNFAPHVSLFTKGSPEQLDTMYNRLVGALDPLQFTLRTFVIGASGHKDAFISV